jgi:hypothetical protein
VIAAEFFNLQITVASGFYRRGISFGGDARATTAFATVNWSLFGILDIAAGFVSPILFHEEQIPAMDQQPITDI